MLGREVFFIIIVMPKIVDHDLRRAEIAAAAAQAIDELGLDRVRLVDVARRASCTTGAVSHYFPGKDAVLEAALEHVLGHLAHEVPRAADRPESTDPVEVFLAGLSEVLPLDEARRTYWRVWLAFCGRAVSTPSLAAQHRDAYAAIQRALVQEILLLGLATEAAEAQEIAVGAVAALDGIGLRAVLEPEEWSRARLTTMLAAQLTPFLRGPRPAVDRAPLLEERSA